MGTTTVKPGFHQSSAGSASEPVRRSTSRVAERFEVLGEISRGGMGRVLKARDRGLNRLVAVKELLSESMTPADFERFRREARSIAQVRHPNVLRVWDFGGDHHHPYLVLELLQGRSLEELIEDAARQGERPDWEQAAALFAPIAEALACCHARGVLHRDIKPANIVVEDGSARPVLIDFGLAKRDPRSCEDSGFSVDLTRTGEMLGTPAFMAPEQYTPGGPFGAIGEATDVWGLGASLFMTLTGQPPYAKARSALEIVRAMVNTDPPRVRSLNPAVPLWLDELVASTLRRKVTERPSMAALGARFRDGLAVSSELTEVELQPGPRSRPGLRLVGLALIAVLATLSAAVLWDRYGPPAEARAIGRVDKVLDQLKALVPADGPLLTGEAEERLERLERATTALGQALDETERLALLGRRVELERWEDRCQAMASLEMAVDAASPVEQSQSLNRALVALRNRRRDERDRRLESLLSAWAVSLRDPAAFDGSESELAAAAEHLLTAVALESGAVQADFHLAAARVRTIQGRRSESADLRFEYLKKALTSIELARQARPGPTPLEDRLERAIILKERSVDVLSRFLDGRRSWPLADQGRLRFLEVIEDDIAAGRLERASDMFAKLDLCFALRRLGPYEKGLIGALARWLVKVSQSSVYEDRVRKASAGLSSQISDPGEVLAQARRAVALEFSERIAVVARQVTALVEFQRARGGAEDFLEELRERRRELTNLMAFLHIKRSHRRMRTLETLEQVARWFPEDPQAWSLYYAAMEDFAFFLVQPRAERPWLFKFVVARPEARKRWRFFRDNIDRAWSVISLAQTLERDRRSLFLEQVQNGIQRAGFGEKMDVLVPERYLNSLDDSTEMPRHRVELWLIRARLHARRGELKAALRDLEHAMAVDEVTAISKRVATDMAHCYMKLGDEESARARLLQAVDRRLTEDALFARGYWQHLLTAVFSGLDSPERRRRVAEFGPRLRAMVEASGEEKLEPILTFFEARCAVVDGDRERAAGLLIEVCDALRLSAADFLRGIIKQITAGIPLEAISSQLNNVDLNHKDAKPY